MDYFSLNRKQLQTLCKKNSIAANLTNVAMAQALTDLLKDSNEAAVLQTPNVRGITDISNATKEAEETVSGTILTSDDDTPAGMKRRRRNASTVTRKTITRQSTKGKGRSKKAEEQVNVEEDDVQCSSDNMSSIPVSCSKLDKGNRVQAVEGDEGKETAEDQFKQEDDAVEESSVRSTRRATRSRACKAEDFRTPRTRSGMGKIAEEKDITTNDCGSGGVEGTGETEKKLMEKEAPTTRPKRKCTEEKLSKPVVEEKARKTNARSVGRNAKPASATRGRKAKGALVFDEKPVSKTPATRGRKAKGTLVEDVHDDPTMTISQEALNNPSDEATYIAEVKFKARGGRNPKGSLRNHDKENEINEETQPAPQIIQDTEETFKEPASEKQEEAKSKSESFEGRKYEDAESQTTLEQKEEMISEKDECKEIGCSLNSPGRTEQGSQEAISDPAEEVIKSECFEVKEENENVASEAKEVLSNEGTKVLSGVEEDSDQKIIEEMILVVKKEADFEDAAFQFEQKSVEEMHLERQQPESSIEELEGINRKDSEKQEELQEIDEKDGREGNQERCLEKQNNENDVQERKEENCLEKQQEIEATDESDGQEKPENKVPEKEENHYVHENCGDRQCQDQEICTIIQESKEVQSEKDLETLHESELRKDMEEEALKSDNDQVAEFGQTVSIEQSDSENCSDKQRQDEEICIVIQEGSKEVQSQRDQETSLESELHKETEEKAVASNNDQFADFVQPVSIEQLDFDNHGGKQRQDDGLCMISREGSKEMESQRDQETPLESELHEEPEKKAKSDNDQVAEFGQSVSIEQWDSDIVSMQPDMDKQEEVQVNKEASSYKPDNCEEGLHEIENASEFCINNKKLKEEQGIEDSKTFIFEMPCENSKPVTFDSAIHGSSHIEISNEKPSELEEDLRPEKSASTEHSEKTNTICVAEFVDCSEIGGSFELHQSSGSEYVEKLEQPNFASHLLCDSSEVSGEFQQGKDMENKDLQEFAADGANAKIETSSMQRMPLGKMNASEGCVEVAKKAFPILDKEDLEGCSLGQLRKTYKEMLTLKNEKKEDSSEVSGEFQQGKHMENKDLQEFAADGANAKIETSSMQRMPLSQMNASEGCVEVAKKAFPILDKEDLEGCSLGQLRKTFKEMLTLKNEKKEKMERISSGRNSSSLMRSKTKEFSRSLSSNNRKCAISSFR